MDVRAIVAVCTCAATAVLAAPARAAIAPHGTPQTANCGGAPLTSVALPLPTGVAVDDVMVATLAVKTTTVTVATNPGGWGAPVADTTENGVRALTYVKVATASDLSTGSVTFTFSGGSTRCVAAVVAYSGVDSATALTAVDKSATATSGGVAGGTAAIPQLTTTNLRATVVAITAWTANNATVTPDTATTERYDTTSPANGTLEVADVVQAAPGQTAAMNATATVTTGRWVAQAIALNEQPELTASFPSDYAWPALTPGTTATSGEQSLSVTSNRSWGVKIVSDRSDGRSRQWSGGAYGSLALANALQWRTTHIGASVPSTSFADLSGSPVLAATGQPAAAGPIAVGVTYRQQVSYADEAALPAGNTYRQNVTYTAQQGF